MMKMTRRFSFVPVLLVGTILLAISILFAGIAAGSRADTSIAEVSAMPLAAEASSPNAS